MSLKTLLSLKVTQGHSNLRRRVGRVYSIVTVSRVMYRFWDIQRRIVVHVPVKSGLGSFKITENGAIR